MILKIEDLYINTDNIVTIGVFENQPHGLYDYECGMIINGTKYNMYNCNGNPQEDLREVLITKVRQFIKVIVDEMTHVGTTDQIVIKEIGFDKTVEVPKREQIND